nr:gag-pol polymerase [Ipomoea batatas]
MSDTLFDIYQYEESSKDLWMCLRQNIYLRMPLARNSCIIDKLPPSWKKVHRSLMQRKEELTMEQLASHLYVEEGIRQKESKNKGGARVTGASGSTINIVDEGKPYGTPKGKGNQERSPKLLSLRRMEKEKGWLLTENFIAMISEICVMQSDDSWWVTLGQPGMSARI